MNTYNIVIVGADGNQRQFSLGASSWAGAISAAKTKAGLAVSQETDESLVIVQKTGKLDFVAA